MILSPPPLYLLRISLFLLMGPASLHMVCEKGGEEEQKRISLDILLYKLCLPLTASPQMAGYNCAFCIAAAARGRPLLLLLYCVLNPSLAYGLCVYMGVERSGGTKNASFALPLM